MNNNIIYNYGNVIDKTEEEFQKLQTKELENIEIQFIRNNKSNHSKLLFNENSDYTYTLKNNIITFQFNELLYINNITVSAEENLNGVKILYSNLNESKEYIIRSKNTSVDVSINTVTNKISIKKPSHATSITLNKIKIFGLFAKDLVTIKEDYNNIKKIQEDLKNKLNDIKSEHQNFRNSYNELKNTIDNLEAKKESLLQTNSGLENKKRSYLNKNKNLLSQNAEIKNDNVELTGKVKEKQSSLDSLNENIGKKREELKKLENDTNLISYDIRDYNKRANEKVEIYIKIVAFFSLIIFCVLCDLYFSVDELALLWKTEKDISLSVIFFTRLPYVFIVSVIIGSCYKICKILISKIMNIHQQQLDLAKIGIIAKDVSDASANELDLTDEAKFELRTNLKMSMLRKYLSKEIGDDYNYELKPSLLEILKEYVETLNKTKSNENKSKELKNEQGED
ncbi:hypothetical protein AVANS14531_07750 [Campylobacter sp. Cr9]|uniref:hypothetical protein n=1 Tax=Campylobacter sp. Cr9 TaxID=2735728 RepID=UPI003014D4DD|nr:hypothetical protein [Campylobacter sp. Cr9]